MARKPEPPAKIGAHFEAPQQQGKRLPAIFYRTEAGGEPVRAWLKGLLAEDRKRIGEDIKTVEFGWPAGMPVCKPLRDGIYEVRTNLAQNRIARVLFPAVHSSNPAPARLEDVARRGIVEPRRRWE